MLDPRALRAALVASPAGPAPTTAQSISISHSPITAASSSDQPAALHTIPRAMPSTTKSRRFPVAGEVASAVTERGL